MAKKVTKRRCEWCGEEFWTTNTRQKYCCRKCCNHRGSFVTPEKMIRENEAKKEAKLASIEAHDREVEASGCVANVTVREGRNKWGQRVTIETRGRC